MALQTIFIKEHIVPNRLYSASLSRVGASARIFFYEPANDYLVLMAMGVKDSWPGWALCVWVFNAETGEIIESSIIKDPQFRPGVITYAWTNNICAGPNGILYKTENPSPELISQVNWYNLLVNAGAFQMNCSHWADPSMFQLGFCTGDPELIQPGVPLYLVVVAANSWTLKIYDFRNATWTGEEGPWTPPVLLGQLALPGVLSSLCSENLECGWLITNKGIIAKFNYTRTPPRWEMISSVQDPTEDTIDYRLTFDSKRKRVVVFRRRPDDPDPDSENICRCQFEFYRPIYKAVGITDPVPISPLRCGEKVRFISHIYGDTGEGVATYLSQVEMLSGGAGGTVLSPHAPAEVNGAILMRYQAPDIPGDDTIKVSASIPNGEPS